MRTLNTKNEIGVLYAEYRNDSFKKKADKCRNPEQWSSEEDGTTHPSSTPRQCKDFESRQISRRPTLLHGGISVVSGLELIT
ncbi:hypothetical protein TNCV_3593081 [Trichonephila clavipes]|nr:hypothetical protein TNCV_3593081 [Trichonephila clavipes]